MFQLGMNTNEMSRNLAILRAKSPIAFEKSLEVAAIQFLTWANNGSTKESRKPPIRRGFLRGSSSTFVGGKLIGMYQGESNEDATSSFPGKGINITWVWNSDYATKMHETDYNPGPISAQDGDAGNKWLEKHLSADREIFMKLIARDFGRRAGTL